LVAFASRGIESLKTLIGLNKKKSSLPFTSR